MKYPIVIEPGSDTTAWGVVVPDLPGCFAAADDWNAIPAAATEALDLWFEDMPDVEPSSLDALRQSEAVKVELAAGGVLLPVPYIPADTAVERVNVTIERALLRAIDETAKARGMTRSSFLASAARHELTGA